MGRYFFLSLTSMVSACFLSLWALGGENSDSTQIHLCINSQKPAHVEVFNELLEMQLLTLPHVVTGECTKNIKPSHFILRQEVTELSPPHDRDRVQVILTLYDHQNVPIMSQVEFIERMTRQSMAARARALTQSIQKAIVSHETVLDPLALPKDQSAPLPITEHVIESVDAPILQNSRDSAHSFELFLGFQRFAQGRYANVYSRRKAMVVTKPFIFIGSRHATRVFRPIIVTNTIKVALTPFELARPIGLHSSPHEKMLKMIDVASDIALQVLSHRYVEAKISVRLAAHYLNANIHDFIPEAHLSTYWQLKQGVNAEVVGFLEIFDTSFAANVGYFPFVQNFAMNSQLPFVNFGWQFGISVESTLYRSFGLKLSLCHAGDNFVYEDNERVVSFNSVAYLGVVMRL